LSPLCLPLSLRSAVGQKGVSHCYCHKQGCWDLLWTEGWPFDFALVLLLGLLFFAKNQSNKSWIFIIFLFCFFQCLVWKLLKRSLIIWKQWLNQWLSPVDCIYYPWKVRVHSILLVFCLRVFGFLIQEQLITRLLFLSSSICMSKWPESNSLHLEMVIMYPYADLGINL